jgi:hypothetical protein
MGRLFYPRKQTSVSAAAMSDPDPDPFADCDIIVCYGGAKPTDKHLASTIRAVDNEIFEFLERRERRRQQRSSNRKSPFYAGPWLRAWSGVPLIRRSLSTREPFQRFCTNLMVATGHFPWWPRIEIRRPCISSSQTLSTVPAFASVRTTALPTSSVWACTNSLRIETARTFAAGTGDRE